MRFIAILPHPPDEITNKYVRLIWVEPVSKMNEELNMSRIKKIPELKPLREAFNLSSDISSACILALLFCSLVPERYAQAKLGSPTSPIAISLWKSINLVIS
jgi:hypothetical protein